MIFTSLTILTWCLTLQSPSAADPTRAFAPIVPLDGHLVLAGHGPTPRYILDAALALSGEVPSRWVVVTDQDESQSADHLEKSGVAVTRVRTDAPLDPALTSALLEADGVWLESAPLGLGSIPHLDALVRSILRRGGVVGGSGSGAIALTAPAFRCVPGSVFDFPEDSDPGPLSPPPGSLGWRVPSETAVFIHHGRRVGAFGKGSVSLQVSATPGWAEREQTLESRDVFDFGDLPGYEVDLLAWLRSAKQRQLPAFPPSRPDEPKLAHGTLVLSGGGGVQSPIWRRFIEAAGGQDARIVCIPSAAEIDPGDEPRSYSARQLREHGCTNVVVLHTSDPRRSHRDPRLLAQLERATGVWIDGGRTYRVMDAFEHTRAHDLMRQVLVRGGAVGGSSAGCQVAGEFLLRGDPRTNQRLVFEGYTRGLGFLPGVIVDAHFRQRDRGDALSKLVGQYPQYLGIGIDEDTSLIIEGSTAEVFGQEAVSFYDARSKSESPVTLREGQRYDLVTRRPLP